MQNHSRTTLTAVEHQTCSSTWKSALTRAKSGWPGSMKWFSALVVEDDALVRSDLAQTLEAEGYKTFEAADAAEAIAVLEANPEIRVVFTISRCRAQWTGWHCLTTSASAGRRPLSS